MNSDTTIAPICKTPKCVNPRLYYMGRGYGALCFHCATKNAARQQRHRLKIKALQLA